MVTSYSTSKDKVYKDIEEYIKAGISAEALKIANGYKEQIAKDIDDAMSDIVARLSTRLLRHYSVLDAKDHIEIHVRKDGLSQSN